MTPEQKDYAQKIAIAGLSGGLVGSIMGQFASEPPTMGKTMLWTVLGGAIAGAGYGFFLRTGGDKGATMLGLGRMRYGYHRGPGAAAGSFAGTHHYQLGSTPGYRYVRRRRVMPGRFSGLGMTIKPGECVSVG